jgi:two-component system, OmpR family, catabolic regulation response regulator CreB
VEKRILLVEDDASFRGVFTHALGEALATEGLDVAFVEAGSLAEARVRLREGSLDIALIDVGMPDGNGLDLVGEINDGGVGPRIPSLVLTAGLDTSVAGRAIEAGAMGALSKLASIPDTVDAIKRLTEFERSEA